MQGSLEEWPHSLWFIVCCILVHIVSFFLDDNDLAFRNFRISRELIGASDASLGMHNTFGIYGGSDSSIKYSSSSTSL